MKKKPPRDPIASFEREARAARRVGQGRKCECGENRPLALIPGSDPVICAACQRTKKGQSQFDDHHPSGQSNNSATVAVFVNDHRAELSPSQYEWPEETWNNPARSPLRAGAADMRGFTETDSYLFALLIIPQAEMLETLDSFLLKRLGPNWWIGTEMECFAPKTKSSS